MGMIKKVKLWWKTSTTKEKILVILGGGTVVAVTASAIASAVNAKKAKAIALNAEEPVPAETGKPEEDKVPEKQKTEYDLSSEMYSLVKYMETEGPKELSSEALNTLYSNAYEISEMQEHPAYEIVDILERSTVDKDGNTVLGEENLKELHDRVYDLAAYESIREERQAEFKKFFEDEKKEEPAPVKEPESGDKWKVWSPSWETRYTSKSGYESVRLADALDVLLRQDDGLLTEEDVAEAEARVEDLARQFAYLEGTEDDFRERFPFLKDHAEEVYDLTEEKKGE